MEPTALLQPIQNLERSIFPDYAPSENSAGKLSDFFKQKTAYGILRSDWS
eukprot:COSAG05_NODE_23928_length_255_cov_0.320513_1_plen_49_part_01